MPLHHRCVDVKNGFPFLRVLHVYRNFELRQPAHPTEQFESA